MDMVEIQCNGIRNKSANLGHNVEVSARSGGTETLIGMIVELESTLRVLRRRLKESLPSDNGNNTKTEGQQIADKILMGCNHPIGTAAWDYLGIAIAKEIDTPIK